MEQSRLIKQIKQQKDASGNVITSTYATKVENALKADKTTTILGIPLDNNILLGEFKTALGEATQSLSGLMSATDKARLDALHALLGVESDANDVVNTINEVLTIFNAYPEGADLVNALSGKVDKTSIVDNVTTDDATKVLSAKQGKALQDTKSDKTYVDDQDQALEERIDNIIVGTIDGASAQEIIDARQGEVSLGANITKVKSQLADKAPQSRVRTTAYDTFNRVDGLITTSEDGQTYIQSGNAKFTVSNKKSNIKC